MCPKDTSNNEQTKLDQELLSLMNIYLTEYTYRDSILWKQCFTFFSVAFIVTLLPYANIWDISFGETIPNYLFPLVGILISIIFLYISNQYAQRLAAISDSYRKLIDMLPQEYRRNNLRKTTDIRKKDRLSFVIPNVMFIALIAFCLFILYLSTTG